jgi:hypothetical protein
MVPIEPVYQFGGDVLGICGRTAISENHQLSTGYERLDNDTGSGCHFVGVRVEKLALGFDRFESYFPDLLVCHHGKFMGQPAKLQADAYFDLPSS